MSDVLNIINIKKKFTFFFQITDNITSDTVAGFGDVG